jgi:hypothetical protein
MSIKPMITHCISSELKKMSWVDFMQRIAVLLHAKKTGAQAVLFGNAVVEFLIIPAMCLGDHRFQCR